MSLFFYGAIEIRDDRPALVQRLESLAAALNWQVSIDRLQNEYPADELFGLPPELAQRVLVFEVASDAYTALYDDYDGEAMTAHYRQLARGAGMPAWESLEFGTSEAVDELYRHNPVPLPVIRFIRSLIPPLENRLVILCIDEGFENRDEHDTVSGTAEQLALSAWQTIAFGYSWPNLNLQTSPR